MHYARNWLALLCVLISADALGGEPSVVKIPRILPAYEELPANFLKFYLQFPGSMERGDVFRYLRLVEIDSEGKEIAEVPEPFREVELWDETFTRMTLWFHPGRQKPGVNLNVEIGPILEEGRRYRLVVSGQWPTEEGKPLGKDLVHEFRAGPIDTAQPDPKGWEISRGEKGIMILLGESLDPVSFRKRVRIRSSATGDVIEDPEWELDENTAFYPRGWSVGSALDSLVIDTRLEDLAGNSVARPFNVDVTDTQPEDVSEEILVSF